MPRKSTGQVEQGYLRSFWEELADMEREHNAVVTVTIYATTQRGVFTVEMRALEMGVMNGGEPLTHAVIKRLPDGGSMPFTGALWYLANSLNNLLTSAVDERLRAFRSVGGTPRR